MSLKNFSKIAVLFLLQLTLSACQWPSYTKILASFTDDPGFDRNLESNKINQLTLLNYYWASTSMTLQCINSSGDWVNIGASTVSTNPDGSLANFNTSATGHPVYLHRWTGAQLIAASGCKVTKTLTSTFQTADWTYSHYTKVLSLRALQPNGATVPAYADGERACFNASTLPDYWDRHSACNITTNDAFFYQHIDEEITRVSRWATVQVWFNYGPQDIFNCDFDYFKVDGVNRGAISHYTNSNPHNVRLLKGVPHTFEVSVNGCTAKANWAGQPACPYISWNGNYVPNPTGAVCPKNTNMIWGAGPDWMIEPALIGTPQTYYISATQLNY